MQVLENERQPIPDVPAVYFVRATEENVLRIADDAARGLYDSMHLNFTPALPRALMERLAAATFASNSAQRIAKARFAPGLRSQCTLARLAVSHGALQNSGDAQGPLCMF